MSKTVAELQAELRQHPSIMRGMGRFDAKLTFDERCSVLALYLSGIHRRVLAAAYGIDRRTVAHIYNKNSIHYKRVRKELAELGRDEFLKRYLTEEATRKCAAVANLPEVTLEEQDYKKKEPTTGLPNKRKSRKEGINVVKPPQCEYSHRLFIQWCDETTDPESGNKLPAGWWYMDMDGNAPDQWFYSSETSLLSSTNALKEAELEIMDRF